ncbi:hypothetical protein MRX96_025366 [Rhipicephalus microplus]
MWFEVKGSCGSVTQLRCRTQFGECDVADRVSAAAKGVREEGVNYTCWHVYDEKKSALGFFIPRWPLGTRGLECYHVFARALRECGERSMREDGDQIEARSEQLR